MPPPSPGAAPGSAGRPALAARVVPGAPTGGAARRADTGYFTPMPRPAHRPKAAPSGGGWLVYLMRCADGSLYTGVATDVARRLKQHNAGTASRYTRSRRPVELVYYEAQPSRSAALRREAAIKALDRPAKLALVRWRTNLAAGGRRIARLEDLPNVGPSVAGDLRRLGVTSPADLPGRDPYALYDELCRVTGRRHDPCVLDTFIAAVRYMEGGPKRPWWAFTAERKRAMAARSNGDR